MPAHMNVTAPTSSGAPFRGRLLAIVTAVVWLLGLLAYSLGLMDPVERQSIDVRFHIRGTQSPGQQIVLVGLDDKSLAAFNQLPPIPRGYYAQVLDRLHGAGARLVGIDVQFIGTSSRPADDAALLAAIARDGPVLLAAPDSGSSIPGIAGGNGASGAMLASVGVDPDRDNVLRRMMYTQVALPTFPVRAAEFLQGRPVAKQGFPDNHAMIDFIGPPGTFRIFSFVDVLHGQVPAKEFSGKTVLIGVTAPVQKDVFITAASSTPMSGVEVHANALLTILHGMPLKPVPDAANILLVFVLGSLPAIVSYRLTSLYMLSTAVGALAVFWVAVQLMFNVGWIVSTWYPAVGLALAAAGSVGVDAFVEKRQRRALETALRGLLRPGHASFFISYRRNQATFVASTLRAELARRFGEASVFMDTSAIGAGQEWPRRIREAILGCSVMLVLISPYWLEEENDARKRRIEDSDDWVRLEIEAALRREEVAVVPLLVDGASMPTERELPESIRPLVHRNAFTLTGESLSAKIEELVNSIQKGRISDMHGSSSAIRDFGSTAAET
jgi:CHASE2 domain-containing sensor protein